MSELALPDDNARILVWFAHAKDAIAECETIPELKNLRDKIEAFNHYTRQQKCSLEVQNAGAEANLWVGRKLGKMLAPHDSIRKPGQRDQISHRAIFDKPKLSELGILPDQSSRWQRIASVPEEIFEEKIEAVKSEAGELTTAAMLRVASEIARAERDAIPSPPLPEGIFSTIEADPPWALDCAEQKSAVGAYTVMSLAKIKEWAEKRKLAEHCAENSHLWLWAINPMLPEAFELIAAWGFTYKTCLTWVKSKGFGTGHYLRGATEHCLLGVRGHLDTLRNDQRTYFEAPVRKRHSTKPDKGYEILESLSPVPRLRLFARDERSGWTSWGNEIDNQKY